MDKDSRFLVRMSMDEPFWLDSFDGGTMFEFTPERKKAWRLRLPEAELKLSQVKKIYPSALIDEF